MVEPVERVKTWPLKKIKPYPNNPRTHPEAQIELLARLMVEHGVDQPIVVDEKGVIIKGHGRLRAAKHAGMKTFPVVVKRGLTEEQKRAERIADNQVALLAGWDRELLRIELRDLELADHDLSLLGFEGSELEAYKGDIVPPEDFQKVDVNVTTEYQCPSCGYQWSGKPHAGKEAAVPSAKHGRGARRSVERADGGNDVR